MNKAELRMNYTRRDVGKIALAALPVGTLLAAPNSNFGGVQIGIIAPYAFRRTANSAEDILKKMVELGIGAVEMEDSAVESFAGAPGGGRRRGRRGTKATPEEQAAARRAAEELKNWRLSVSMDKFAALRQMYSDGGVRIYAFKLRLDETMSDAEYDYCFNVAKSLGASHVTMELNENSERIGRFAAKHRIYVGYHNHRQVNEQSWDAALAQSEYNGINLDVGHFTAAISKSPIAFIQKHHARIQSMHLKDRKYGTKGSDNMPWGQGDTPLREVLELMKREQYKFPATIELEYPVPEGSDVMRELAKCFQYCKDVLS